VACVEAHSDARWVVLYVKRWLAAGLRMPDGSTTERLEGTPQGGLCSATHKDPNAQCRVMRSVAFRACLWPV
jgi:retron-type reverse transcriptase